MTLLLGVNRSALFGYLSGDRSISETDAPQYLRVIQNLHMYLEGDTVYNRTLSLLGGRSNSGGSHRISEETQNWGFFHFPLNTTETVISKNRQLAPIKQLERDMIETGKEITYKDFIDTVYATYPELQKTGCIFVFSNCGKVVSGTPKQIGEVALHQRLQDLKLLAQGKAGYTNTYSSNTVNANPFVESQSGIQLNVSPWPNAPAQPSGTKTIWIQEGQSYKQLFTNVSPSSQYWTNMNIRRYKRENPMRELFTLENGQLKKLGGGGSARKKRKSRIARTKTRKLNHN